MLFTNPAFLWALLLGSVPILIYLLMRYRSLKVRWGANYVLERALERLKNKRYWDQILLIALRCLAIMLIALAFARPASTGDVGSTGRHHVVVVDASYSMLAAGDDRTRWESGLQTLTKMAETWPRGDTWSLYLADESRPPDQRWLVEGRVVAQPADTVGALNDLQVAEARASIPKALQAVADRFADAKAEVILLADDQRSSWEGIEQVSFAANPMPIYWINPPLSDRENLAVVSVRAAHRRVLADHPVRVFVEVRNFGKSEANDAQVELLIDGAIAQSETLKLLPGQQSTLHFDLQLPRRGSHYIEARLTEDALAFDNAHTAGLVVSDELNVMVLKDAGPSGTHDSAWRYLAAIQDVQGMTDDMDRPLFTKAPIVLGKRRPDQPAQPHTGPLTAEDLKGIDVVVLDGGRTLDTQQAGLLRQFVQGGGGLLLAADQNVQPGVWADTLGGENLLPVQLKAFRSEQGGGPQFRSLDRGQFPAAALQAFESPEMAGDLGNAIFYAWWVVQEPPADARVLARYDNGEPFAIASDRPLGRVVLLTAGLTACWNNLVVRGFFVPLAYRLLFEAASGGVYPRTVGLNEPVRLLVPDPETLKAVTLFSTTGEPVGAPFVSRPAGAVATASAGSDRSGRVSMLVSRTGGKTERVYYGVQGPRVDSDLAGLAAAEKDAATEQLDLQEVANWGELSQRLQAARAGNDWHHWVLMAALAMLVGEKLMERRFI